MVSANRTEVVGIEVPTSLLIGGEWTGGRGGGTLSVIDPSTEDALAEVADGTVEDALDAVSAAQDALAGWAATPPRQRAECLRRTFELMTTHAESLARLMAAENGKALRDARARRDEQDPGHPAAGRRVTAGYPVEFPGRDGYPQDRPGAGGGLHGGAQ